MTADSPRLCHCIFARLRKAAEDETAIMLKKFPKEYRDQVRSAVFCFLDQPTKEMIAAKVSPEAFSTTNRNSKRLRYS